MIIHTLTRDYMDWFQVLQTSAPLKKPGRFTDRVRCECICALLDNRPGRNSDVLHHPHVGEGGHLARERSMSRMAMEIDERLGRSKDTHLDPDESLARVDVLCDTERVDPGCVSATATEELSTLLHEGDLLLIVCGRRELERHHMEKRHALRHTRPDQGIQRVLRLGERRNFDSHYGLLVRLRVSIGAQSV